MKTVIIKGKTIRYTDGPLNTVILNKDDLMLLEDSGLPVVGRDNDAGRKIYSQVDELIRNGTRLQDIKASDITNAKVSTVYAYLSVLKSISKRKETCMNSMYIMRRVRRFGCLALLSVL